MRAIIEGIMLDLMYEVPSRDDVTTCVITEETVTNKIVAELNHANNKDGKKEESA